MSEITPNSFRLTLPEEAQRLLRSAMANSTTHKLDARTSMWIIREEAWLDFARTSARDFITTTSMQRNELLGLPVRITTGDAPDVPMIQLVMEPAVQRRVYPR